MDGRASVKYVIESQIEGALVECGVEQGNFQKLWIAELQSLGVERDIFLYDTFGGLTPPGANDYTTADTTLYSMSAAEVNDYWANGITAFGNTWCYCPLETVQQSLRQTGYPERLLHYVKGDVMETLRTTIPDTIAVLRLDTDWYESSKFELEIMYDRVAAGGVIIFDDYYHWAGQRRATDEFFQARGIVPNIVNIGNSKTAAMIKTH